MSKLKEKLKASMRTEVSRPDANLNGISPENVSHAPVEGEQHLADSRSVERKASAAMPIKKSASMAKVQPGTQNCLIWPD